MPPNSAITSSLEQTFVRSTFGTQAISQRPSSPAYGFGSSTRAVHAKTFQLGRAPSSSSSPGPARYSLHSSSAVGSQAVSRHTNAPAFGFGTSQRFGDETRAGTPTRAHRREFDAAWEQARPSTVALGSGAYSLSLSSARGAFAAVGGARDGAACAGYGFGKATREAPVYLGREAMRLSTGQLSPGPASMSPRSTFLRQPLSGERSAARVSFGTESRRLASAPHTAERAELAPPPQPEAVLLAAVGSAQVVSTWASPPAISFPRAGRETVCARVFISRAHAERQGIRGRSSPGPAGYGSPDSSVGRQVRSNRTTPPSFGFGTCDRLAAHRESTPGPGQYNV